MNEPTTARPAADKRNKVSTAIGKSLKAHRLAAKKSQEKLAFDANMDRAYVSQIERGVTNPSASTLAHLCHGLGITLADLFAPVKISMAPEDSYDPQFDPALKPKKSRLR
jgi:transcriptional regulator with XRE-family HTH domain